MTKRTRAIHWGRLLAASLMTVCERRRVRWGANCTVSVGQGGPDAGAELRNPAPTILSVTPSIGSSGGGAAIAITGAGLLPGVRVAFGATNVAGILRY